MRIHIFGDSIVHGAIDIEKGGWANRLMCYFWEHWDEYGGVNVHHFGIDGNMSGDVCGRCEAEMVSWKPDVVIFSVGLNDAARIPSGEDKTSLDTYTGNIQQLVGLAQKYTQTVVFLGLTRVDESRTSISKDGVDWTYTNDRIAQCDALLEETAKKLGVHYVPCADVVPIEHLEDGLHPDSRGHELLFEHIRDALCDRGVIKRV